jgi:signal transduction histidine kinase
MASHKRLELMVNERTVELKKANEELAALARQLETALKSKAEFLSNMSHELRTPLNSIIGFSEVLLDGLHGPVNEKQREYLKFTHEGGLHLLDLINDVLEMSKIEAGKLRLSLGVFPLRKLLLDVSSMVRETAFRKGIELSCEAPEELGEAQADPLRIKEIVLNLLSNAIKFTPRGGRVGLRALRGSEEFVVEVFDDGPGLAPRHLERVFEAFIRVESRSQPPVEGTGLGLTICKKLVELHGGRIWLESGPDRKGLSAKFTLPILPPAETGL